MGALGLKQAAWQRVFRERCPLAFQAMGALGLKQAAWQRVFRERCPLAFQAMGALGLKQAAWQHAARVPQRKAIQPRLICWQTPLTPWLGRCLGQVFSKA